MKVTPLALTLVLMTIVAGRTAPHATPEASEHAVAYQSQYERVTLVFPRGNPDDGRQAFLDLQCTVCHRVAGEPDFPEPFAANPGPILDRALASRPTRYLAEAMVSPSHSISINVSDELKERMDGVLSPMADYSHAMSVRQMIDLLAFLTAISE